MTIILYYYYYYYTTDRYHIKNGQFSSLAQYPQPPTERIYCNTLSQWPRNEVRSLYIKLNKLLLLF